jgi:hypothetical protein
MTFADAKLPVLKYMLTEFMALPVHFAQGCTNSGRLSSVRWPPSNCGFSVWFFLCYHPLVPRLGKWHIHFLKFCGPVTLPLSLFGSDALKLDPIRWYIFVFLKTCMVCSVFKDNLVKLTKWTKITSAATFCYKNEISVLKICSTMVPPSLKLMIQKTQI